MNNHQGTKAEVDARNHSFSSCIELGKSLLARRHYASEEVRAEQLERVEQVERVEQGERVEQVEHLC